MNAKIAELHKRIADFESTDASYRQDLQMSFCALVIHKLKRLNWTRKRLAAEAGVKESFVSRILQADMNCTFATAGKLLRALDVRGAIVDSSRTDASSEANTTGGLESMATHQGQNGRAKHASKRRSLKVRNRHNLH